MLADGMTVLKSNKVIRRLARVIYTRFSSEVCHTIQTRPLDIPILRIPDCKAFIPRRYIRLTRDQLRRFPTNSYLNPIQAFTVRYSDNTRCSSGNFVTLLSKPLRVSLQPFMLQGAHLKTLRSGEEPFMLSGMPDAAECTPWPPGSRTSKVW